MYQIILPWHYLVDKRPILLFLFYFEVVDQHSNIWETKYWYPEANEVF